MQTIKDTLVSTLQPAMFKLYIPTDETFSIQLLYTINEVTKGCTIYTGKGMWISDDNKLYDEDVVILEVFHTLNESQEKRILQAIYDWGVNTMQELIAMTIDNRFLTMTTTQIKNILENN